MMPVIDRDGTFRAAPNATVGVEESTKAGSLSVCAVFRFKITAKLDGDNWVDWSEFDYFAYYRAWFIGTDGTTHQKPFDAMTDVLGWDGNIESLDIGGIRTPACQIVTENDPYKGQNRFKVKWVNSFDSVPGCPASPEILKKLQGMYGAQLRAAAGPRPVEQPKPAGAPAPPPAPPANKAEPGKPAKGSPSTMEEAWECYAPWVGRNDYTQADVERLWNEAKAELFGDRPLVDYNADHWAAVAAKAPIPLPF